MGRTPGFLKISDDFTSRCLRCYNQPFANLLTIVPVLLNVGFTPEAPFTYYVGFLVDLAEHPGCISGKNANRTYRVNHSTSHVSGPVDAPNAPTDHLIPVLQRDNPAERMELQSMRSLEADSPWTVRDGPPPPYALSPDVFYHTSRMGMLSP